MSGWIKLYRDIEDHWVFKDSEVFKRWIRLIMMANFEESRILVGGNVVVIGKGQMILSQQNIAEKWNISRQTLRTFLNHLEKDGMILRNFAQKTNHKITILTICNYSKYQDSSVTKNSIAADSNVSTGGYEPINDNFSPSANLKQNSNHKTTSLNDCFNYENTLSLTTNQPQSNHRATTEQPQSNQIKEGKELKELKEDIFTNVNIGTQPKKINGHKFIKPSLDEIKEYCKERGNDVRPHKFIDYYESNGWKVGKNPMKDWKAAVRNWEGEKQQSQEVVWE